MKLAKHFLIVILIFVQSVTTAQVLQKFPHKEANFKPIWISKAQEKLVFNRFTIPNKEKKKRGNEKSGQDSSKGQPTYSSSDITNLPQYEEGRLFVKFKSSAAGNIKSFSNQSQRRSAIGNEAIEKALSVAKVVQFKKPAENLRLEKTSQIYKASLEVGMSAEAAIGILEKLPEVEYAEKVPKYYILQDVNDPSYLNDLQYALDLIHAPAAFALQQKTHEVFVAIVDDAFLYDHPDLVANVDISKCYDVADNDADTRPPNTGDNKAGPFTFSHGTHVGGIAGAVTNNSFGVASVSNNSIKLFGIKATSDDTNEPRDIEASFEGVAKAIENGANVINMSFGGTAISTAWQDMIDEAAAQGVVFVAAAGNGNTSEKTYPAAYNNVIAVANTDENDEKSPLSHFGDWVDISAPGSTIYSTVVDEDGTSGAFSFLTGTSMSSPMVAGLAGMLLAENSSLSANEIRNIIQSSSDNIEAANPGYEGRLGAGRINVYNALLEARGLQRNPEASFISSGQDIYTGQSVVFSSQSLGNDLNYAWSFPGGIPDATNGETAKVIYNSPGTYAVSLTISNGAGSDIVSIPGYITVVVPDDCTILSFPFPGTREFFSFVDDDGNSEGPVVGHNINEFTQYANRYSYLPGNYISGGLVAVGQLLTDNPKTRKVIFKIWEEANVTKIPGKVLATEEVFFKDIKITNQGDQKGDRASYTEVIFDEPPRVPANGNFFMGFEIFYESGDTIGFYTNDDGEGNGNDSYFFFEGGWEAFSTLDNFQSNIEMMPVVVSEKYLEVEPFLSESGACAGNTVSFNTEAMQDVSAFQWTFEGGTPATSTAANPVVEYATAGEYEAKLVVTLADCEVSSNTIVQTIKIVDCEQSPGAEFSADKRVIAAGDSVQFFENSEHATGYSWAFDGGSPVNSALADPFITYTTPGTYPVRLEVQNPNADVAAVVKEDFITVLEADACNTSLDLVLNDPFPAPGQVYTATDGGYITGHNTSGDLAKVEFFPYEGSGVALVQLDIRFGEVNAGSQSSALTVVVYDSDGQDGGPGTLLSSTQIMYADIEVDVANNTTTSVSFDEPFIPVRPFYAGIMLSYENPLDTIALVASEDDFVDQGTAWELAMNEETAISYWVPTSQRWFFGTEEDPDYLNISYFISAKFEEIIKVPFASVNVSDTDIPIGGTVSFDASESFAYEEFEWFSTAPVQFDQNQLVQEIQFNSRGMDTVTFIARNGCSRETRKEFIINVGTGPLGIPEEDASKINKVEVYPNPFESKTNLRYSLAETGHVKVEIFNSLGQKISTVIDEDQGKGSHTVIFDGSALPKGLYIYSIQFNDSSKKAGRLILH